MFGAPDRGQQLEAGVPGGRLPVLVVPEPTEHGQLPGVLDQRPLMIVVAVVGIQGGDVVDDEAPTRPQDAEHLAV